MFAKRFLPEKIEEDFDDNELEKSSKVPKNAGLEKQYKIRIERIHFDKVQPRAFPK